MASEAKAPAEMYMNKNIFQASFEKSNPLETFGVSSHSNSKPDIPFFLRYGRKVPDSKNTVAKGILALKNYDPLLWPFATLRYLPLPIYI